MSNFREEVFHKILVRWVQTVPELGKAISKVY